MFRSRNLKRRIGSLFVRTEGEFATAVVLVVDVMFADETVAAVLKAAFPPIFAPPSHLTDRQKSIGPGRRGALVSFRTRDRSGPRCRKVTP